MLGFAVGDSEDGAFWTAFLRSLKARGLAGTQLVISDAHAGLNAAIGAVLLGAGWQRCRVHFHAQGARPGAPRNSEMVAAAIRTVFAQADAEHVRSQLDVIAGMLGRQGDDLAERRWLEYFSHLLRRVLGTDVDVDLAQPWRRDGPVYGDPRLIPQRLGQQAFQAVVLGAYSRRCAITGDKDPPCAAGGARQAAPGRR